MHNSIIVAGKILELAQSNDTFTVDSLAEACEIDSPAVGALLRAWMAADWFSMRRARGPKGGPRYYSVTEKGKRGLTNFIRNYS